MEIKAAYRKLALTLHPDRHDGCQVKTQEFKAASEAYNILSDNNRRREYDMATGWAVPEGWYNKNRRRPPPSNYRKVYAPHAPPDGKWHDAQRHYDMHYGDGQFHDAVKQAYKRAEAAGEFDYHSPLGKGFTFETMDDRKSYHKNPYSKEYQGPIIPEYKYDENDAAEAKTILRQKKNVVDKLHGRRKERLDRETVGKPVPSIPGQRIYEPLNQQSSESCTIM